MVSKQAGPACQDTGFVRLQQTALLSACHLHAYRPESSLQLSDCGDASEALPIFSDKQTSQGS